MKRKSLSRINGLDADDAIAPRCQPSPSQENLQEGLIYGGEESYERSRVKVLSWRVLAKEKGVSQTE